MNLWNRKQTPLVALPTRIDAAGTTSVTITGGTVRAFVAKAETALSQLRVTIDGQNFDCTISDGWELTAPNGEKFVNDVTLTALASTFIISTIK